MEESIDLSAHNIVSTNGDRWNQTNHTQLAKTCLVLKQASA